MHGFKILGLGTALPEFTISQTAMATFAATCVAPELTGSRIRPDSFRLCIDGRESNRVTAFYWNHRPMTKQLRNASLNSSTAPKIGAQAQRNA